MNSCDLVLIDYPSMARKWSALYDVQRANVKTDDGQYVGVVYGLFLALRDLKRTYDAQVVVVCGDYLGDKTNLTIYYQGDWIKRLCGTLGVEVVTDGTSSGNIIDYILGKVDQHVVILTEDLIMNQFLKDDGKTRIIRDALGPQYTWEECCKDYQMPPDTLPLYFAIAGVGDWPGLPNVGEKRARKVALENPDIDTWQPKAPSILRNHEDLETIREGLKGTTYYGGYLEKVNRIKGKASTEEVLSLLSDLGFRRELLDHRDWIHLFGMDPIEEKGDTPRVDLKLAGKGHIMELYKILSITGRKLEDVSIDEIMESLYHLAGYRTMLVQALCESKRHLAEVESDFEYHMAQWRDFAEREILKERRIQAVEGSSPGKTVTKEQIDGRVRMEFTSERRHYEKQLDDLRIHIIEIEEIVKALLHRTKELTVIGEYKTMLRKEGR